MRIFIGNEENNFGDYSIEAGKHDGVKHFDHHGKYGLNPAVCLMSGIPRVFTGNIYMTHLDYDSLEVLSRMIHGEPLFFNFPNSIAGIIDAKGPEFAPLTKRGFRVRAYMSGIKQLAHDWDLGTGNGNVEDLTYDIMDFVTFIRKNPGFVKHTGEKILQESREKIDKSISFRLNQVALCEVNGSIDMVELYRRGIHSVVLYNLKTQKLSVYGSHKLTPTPIKDYRRQWAGLPFAGHALACGLTPRGSTATREEAQSVAAAIADFAYSLQI